MFIFLLYYILCLIVKRKKHEEILYTFYISHLLFNNEVNCIFIEMQKKINL